MVIGFKQNFVPPILAGTKIHTVREDVNDRWKPGVVMHMATGVRSKHYNCFKEVPCVSYQRIFMSYDYMLNISVSGRELFGHHEREQFAINDGFENYKAFVDWWYPVLMKHPDQTYSGKVIHWTNFRY